MACNKAAGNGKSLQAQIFNLPGSVPRSPGCGSAAPGNVVLGKVSRKSVFFHKSQH